MVKDKKTLKIAKIDDKGFTLKKNGEPRMQGDRWNEEECHKW